MSRDNLRRRAYRQLEPGAWPRKGLSPLNLVLVAIILLATVVAILRTEPTIEAGRHHWFDVADVCFGTIFVAEFGLRIWSAGEDPHYRGFLGRVSYVIRPASLIDMVVIVATFAPMLASGLVSLRMLRVITIVRFARLGRFSSALRHLTQAVSERRDELLLTLLLGFGLIVCGATAMWLVEGDAQPDKFGSIPRAMWWAAVTLTTIGYGDVYPVTIFGKVIAVGVAIGGIGLIAMPAGILAAAFSDAIQRSRSAIAAGEGGCDGPRDGTA
jgi:voltage-gated potassium channel